MSFCGRFVLGLKNSDIQFSCPSPSTQKRRGRSSHHLFFIVNPPSTTLCLLQAFLTTYPNSLFVSIFYQTQIAAPLLFTGEERKDLGGCINGWTGGFILTFSVSSFTHTTLQISSQPRSTTPLAFDSVNLTYRRTPATLQDWRYRREIWDTRFRYASLNPESTWLLLLLLSDFIFCFLGLLLWVGVILDADQWLDSRRSIKRVWRTWVKLVKKMRLLASWWCWRMRMMNFFKEYG